MTPDRHRLSLTLAVADYDHVRDLTSGLVAPAGIDLSAEVLPVHEIFGPFLSGEQTWDAAEMSLAKYVTLVSQDDPPLIGLPIFPSRAFRHTSIFVRESAVSSPEDLRGTRIGVPEWAQTAGVYVRGLLADRYGVQPHEIEWIQAGVNEPGRKEKVSLQLPEGVTCTPSPEHSLNELLLSGAIDAAITAEPPDAFSDPGSEIKQLFDDPAGLERQYWEEERVFPIMHLITLRREVVEANPWVAESLTAAFERAKQRSLERVFDVSVSRFPLPWVDRLAADVQDLFESDDPWPYGMTGSRSTLETFVRYAFEQGVAHRVTDVDELFPV